MSVAGRLAAVRSTLPEGVTLVAVSKFHPVEALREAYDAGQRIFAESRVQELLPKTQAMPADVCWHFIGHLQRNKAKMVVGCADLIESVDSLALLALIGRARPAWLRHPLDGHEPRLPRGHRTRRHPRARGHGDIRRTPIANRNSTEYTQTETERRQRLHFPSALFFRSFFRHFRQK